MQADSDRSYPLSVPLRSVLGKMRMAESQAYAPLPVEALPWKTEKGVEGTGWKRVNMVTVGYRAIHT